MSCTAYNKAAMRGQRYKKIPILKRISGNIISFLWFYFSHPCKRLVVLSYNTVSEMRFPNPEKIRKSVESCTSAWPFSIFEI